MRRARHRRGFTLTELLIAVVVLSILGAILLPGMYSLLRDNNRTSNNLVLTGAIAHAHNIAARDGNGYQFPSTLAADLAAIDTRYVTGNAASSDISVHRVSGDIAIYAAWVNGTSCSVVVDSIVDDTATWAVDDDASYCDASIAAANSNSVTGTLYLPTVLDF